MDRRRRCVARGALGAGIVAATALPWLACVVAPPANFAVVTHRPVILHGSVDPSADMPLPAWPSGNVFTIPLEFVDPNPKFVWSAFVDYDGGMNPSAAAFSLAPPAPAVDDGGVYLLAVSIDPLQSPTLDLARCHQIQVLVGHDFVRSGPNGEPDLRAFDSVGHDSVTWQYVGPATANGCASLDPEAGADGRDDASLGSAESGVSP
jgi:hypothetical protein